MLIEFSTKSSQFQSWILDNSNELNALRLRAGDPCDITKSKNELKILDDKILSGVNELKIVSQLASKINVEICNYIDDLKQKEVLAAHLLPQLHRQQINDTVKRIQVYYFFIKDLKFFFYLGRLQFFNLSKK